MLPFENRYECSSLWPVSSHCEHKHLVCIIMGFPLLHLSLNKNQMSQRAQKEIEWKRLFCALVSCSLMISKHVRLMKKCMLDFVESIIVLNIRVTVSSGVEELLGHSSGY